MRSFRRRQMSSTSRPGVPAEPVPGFRRSARRYPETSARPRQACLLRQKLPPDRASESVVPPSWLAPRSATLSSRAFAPALHREQSTTRRPSPYRRGPCCGHRAGAARNRRGRSAIQERTRERRSRKHRRTRGQATPRWRPPRPALLPPRTRSPWTAAFLSIAFPSSEEIVRQCELCLPCSGDSKCRDTGKQHAAVGAEFRRRWIHLTAKTATPLTNVHVLSSHFTLGSGCCARWPYPRCSPTDRAPWQHK